VNRAFRRRARGVHAPSVVNNKFETRTPLRTSLSPEPKEVDEMAASLIIEQESGTSTGWIHPHNGYYAGDFWGPRHHVQGSDSRQ